MISNARVLIGCPTYESYKYCLRDYVDAVKSLTYKNADLVLVDNSKTEDFTNDIKALGVAVERIDWDEDVAKRIEKSRNKLREIMLEKQYDYFLSLEQDVIPPIDVLEKLMSHQQDVVTGVYYYPAKVNLSGAKQKEVLIPLVSKPHPTNKDLMRPCTSAEVEENQVFKIRGCGLGCVLIKRRVMEKIAFKFRDRDDAQNFSNDCWEHGFIMIADTSVKCRHLLKNKPLWVTKLLQERINQKNP